MIKKFIKISLLAILMFGSNTFAKEPTAQEIQSWIVIQSSEHVVRPWVDKEKKDWFFKIYRGNEPCIIGIQLSVYRSNDIEPWIDEKGTVNFKKDVSHIEVENYPKEEYYLIRISGNVQVHNKDRTISSEKDRWIMFKDEKNRDRHLKAYKKLLEICRDVKEDLF